MIKNLNESVFSMFTPFNVTIKFIPITTPHGIKDLANIPTMYLVKFEEF